MWQGGRGVLEFMTKHDKGGGGSKMAKNCITLFMDDPQIVGILMGANFSPNLANLYLHFYESIFLGNIHVFFFFLLFLRTINRRDSKLSVLLG